MTYTDLILYSYIAVIISATAGSMILWWRAMR